MKRPLSAPLVTSLKLIRLAVQALCLVLAIVYGPGLIRNAGLPGTVFLVLIAVIGLFFCGWFCPFGTIQEWIRRIDKSYTGIDLNIPEKIDRYLSFSRYILLGLTVLLAIRMSDDPRHTFLRWMGGGTAETAAWIGVGVVLLLALFIDRPFCRYVCGFGATYGLFTMLRVLTIKRDSHACTGCGQCSKTCQMGVSVSRTAHVRDPHCISCMECLHACPVPGALTLRPALPCLADVKALKNKYLSRSADKMNAA